MGDEDADAGTDAFRKRSEALLFALIAEPCTFGWISDKSLSLAPARDAKCDFGVVKDCVCVVSVALEVDGIL